MMKKILAAAIVSAFAAPAFAATANVDVYGNFSMSVDSLSDGSDRGTNVSSNASRIGFKGAEDLGGGLNAIWQAEFTLGLDDSTSFGASRDTFVGLKSKNLGTFRLGFFDTPTKQLSRKLDLFNNQIGDTRNLLRTNGADGAGANAWEERFRNGIRYDTPSFAGFSGAVHYSTQANSAAAANNNDREAYSLGANYSNGPLFAGIAYQKNNVTASTDETALRLGVGFNMGDLKLTALYHDASDQGGVNNADRKVWGLGAGYKLGNGMIKGQYYKADDSDALADSGADLYAVGYDYNLSKRTMVYAAYAKAKNDTNAVFRMSGGGGHGDSLKPAAAGSDPSGFSLGVTHKF